MHPYEPWRIERRGRNWIARTDAPGPTTRDVLREIGGHEGRAILRAIACVNACADVPDPDALPEALRILVQVARWPHEAFGGEARACRDRLGYVRHP